MNIDISPFIDADGHIVVTFLNNGYFDYLLNLHENIKRTNIAWILCAVCVDQQAFDKCAEHNINAVSFASMFDNPELKEYSSWNDARWSRIQFAKLDVIARILENEDVKTLTYIDGDIHVYSDFVPYLKELAIACPDIRLFIQADHNTAIVNEFGNERCAGFFHIKNCAEIKRLITYTEEDVKKNTINADQQHINSKVAEYNLPTMQLDRARFPNGVFVNNKNIPKEAHLIHYNWMIGSEKRKKMMDNGHWYLSHLNVLRHKTQVVYPPFKQGLYLEEYFSKHNTIRGNRYIDVHWTNLQIDPRFAHIRQIAQNLVDELYPYYPPSTYFTVVQHDNGVMFRLPPNTRVYAAGGNNVTEEHVPIPLIYEDESRRLESLPRIAFNDKDILCSFVGSMTHPVRHTMKHALDGQSGFEMHCTDQWAEMVSEEKQQRFVDITCRSKFCLAPRGYGRTSFRFYEAFLLGTVPVYVWDDIEWLPYKEHLDYSKFAVIIHVSELASLDRRLNAIGEEEYDRMRAEYARVNRWFTLEGMTEYIVGRESGAD